MVRRLRRAPLAGTAVTLVSRERHLVYTGMVPGLIAGHYPYEACCIDLERLCRAADVSFVEAEIVAADLGRCRVRCTGGRDWDFDLLSLDVGAVPDLEGVRGAREHALAAKPVDRLLAGWTALLAAAEREPQSVLVVGGGAGGVELALAMAHRLYRAGVRDTRIALATGDASVLASHPPAARRWLSEALARRGIAVHAGCRVTAVEAGAVRVADGARLSATWVVWAGSAAAPRWLAQGGLACDSRGFVAVDETLRSLSHDNVFAAGDCASIAGHPRPKAGVYAVRAGPPLADNLRRTLAGAPLRRYRPQRHALALISTGERLAVATWNGFALRGAWAWRWKDWIDRRFVARYHAPDEDARRPT